MQSVCVGVGVGVVVGVRDAAANDTRITYTGPRHIVHTRFLIPVHVEGAR